MLDDLSMVCPTKICLSFLRWQFHSLLHPSTVLIVFVPYCFLMVFCILSIVSAFLPGCSQVTTLLLYFRTYVALHLFLKDNAQMFSNF